MFQLVYSSTARALFTAADIKDILAVSREKNQFHGITGMLLYKLGSVVQVLEGEEPAVRQLYANIEKDRRHRDVTLIYTQPIARREFAEWTMGFHSAEFEFETPPAGFNPIFQTTNQLAGIDGRGAALLRTFVDVTK